MQDQNDCKLLMFKKEIPIKMAKLKQTQTSLEMFHVVVTASWDGV